MKNLKIILAGIFVLFLSLGVFAQGNPPDPPDGHGEDTDQDPGGQAPIGAGTLLLISLGAVYGGKRVYDLKKKS